MARVLWDRYFCVFGFPERIHSNQGAKFESQLISELLRVSGIRKSDNPLPSDGKQECGVIQSEKADCPRCLQTLTFMYNCAAHETTGYPPFYLMFGRVPCLPFDVLFQTVLNDSAVTN